MGEKTVLKVLTASHIDLLSKALQPVDASFLGDVALDIRYCRLTPVLTDRHLFMADYGQLKSDGWSV